MTHPGALDLELLSEPKQLRRVRDAIQDWGQRCGWAEHDIADVVLAVDEALTNVIRHVYANQPGHRILVHVCACRDARRGAGLEVRIRDFGRQVPLDQICGRDLDDLRPGGLGVHIMRSVMDSCEYHHVADGGTELRLRRFPRPCEPPGDPPPPQDPT